MREITRRGALKGSAAGLAAAGVIGAPAIAQARRIKIGYVSPQTGPLAPFAEADNFVIAGVREATKAGLSIGGRNQPFEILVKDSQSNPNRAAEVASDLILKDEVDLMLVASTPETTNPVCDQCEVNEVPCVSSVAPWQPWFFARGGKPDTGFKYTYHFFWGLEDVIAVYTNMWGQVPTNKSVGGLFPNDGDGNAWGDKERGFPPVLGKLGYKLTDPGRFQNLNDNFSAQISAFKAANVEVVTGVVIPPDLTTFWNQAQQQGFKPKAVSIGKALLFPVVLEGLGNAGHNLSTEVWWTPHHPFKSSLTGARAQQLADGYTQASKKQWTQPIGFVHALFEVAVDVMKRSKGAGERASVLDAAAKTRLDTIVGPIAWGAGPVKNVAKTPLVGGQWRRGGTFKYDLVITDNQTAPNIPIAGKMEAIG
ncbi:ABC transporter substrate-binding protein [Vineibacter terrae]|uniref:ABC transporter substrate-binding protein n=1 Tax=Vineibacter terrae TaxID=2586908 RepID=A0A5C8PVB4_9HYPH|nr:ABC transporter substrate-binding protein [Vineibacter terrae]TXL82044.1 ABC transporter substrate-binding protein [Vineibacter terrae]